MLVNQHTKIATLLKHHPRALETIVSINPRFEKLRNPIIRKLMAQRTSISMAARIAGCAEEDFFKALQPLGFELTAIVSEKSTATQPKPVFLQSVAQEKVKCLDVRPVLDSGSDPLKEILAAAKGLKPGEVLKIINTFEPTPLIVMLQRKGFHSWNHTIHHGYTETWFYKVTETAGADLAGMAASDEGWQEVREQFADRLLEIDVRELVMPQPMIKILETLDRLPQAHALYVVHKWICTTLTS
jgi:uncharacterized protein (DUF2249 family)